MPSPWAAWRRVMFQAMVSARSQPALFAGGGEGGQHRFAAVHVGVLAAVGDSCDQSALASSAYRPCAGSQKRLPSASQVSSSQGAGFIGAGHHACA
jgi:hypothetical protein